MVQLKSFRYTDQSSENSPSANTNPVGRQEEPGKQNHPERAESLGGSSLSVSTIIGGGNLTASTSTSSEKDHDQEAQNDVSSKSLSSSSSGEFQSAVHEIGDDDEEEDSQLAPSEELDLKVNFGPMNNGPNSKQGKLEDIAKQRAAVKALGVQQQLGADNLVTRITVEKGSITNLASEQQNQLNAIQQQNYHQTFAQQQQQQQQNSTPETARNPRFKLMKRSQTSPSALSQAGGNGGPTSYQNRAIPLGKQSGQPLSMSNMSPATMRAQSPGDNTSQFSFSTQKNYNNHFEIRWQNVRLYTGKKETYLPEFIGNSFLFKYFSSDENEENLKNNYQANVSSYENAMQFHTPPIRHKIPPTINETSEIGDQIKPPSGLVTKSVKNTTDLAIEEGPLFTCVSGEMIDLGARQTPISSQTANQEGRCILNNMSGQVFSGQMTAILGPSGVGKTTLLNSLTGRNTLDGSGRVSLIGANSRKRMSVVTVPQNDVLPGKLTTIEDLMFTSRLKNPQSNFDHQRNVERIVTHLHMTKFLHTRIDKLSGGEERRLSIGRELLVCPDIMILDEPTSGLDANTCRKIISALRDIVEHSDNILDKPMSIIVTIHQPQQEVYNLFHRVYVMAMGGRVIFEGVPNMLLPTLLTHSSLCKVSQADSLNENPAIVAIEVASGEYGPQIIDELATYHENQVYDEFSSLGYLGGAQPDTPTDLNNTYSPIQTPRSLRNPRISPLIVSRYENRQRKRLNSFGNDSIGRPTPIMAKRHFISPSQMDRVSNITSVSYASTYDNDLPELTSKLKVDKRLRRSVVMKSHSVSHTWTLMQRCWLLTKRDLFLMAIRILGFSLVAAGMVQIFSGFLDPNEHLCPKYESEVDNVLEFVGNVKERLSDLDGMLQKANAQHMFFFQLVLCTVMVTSALTGLVFPLQMRMFLREYKNGWYSPGSFILSQTLAELPSDIIGPLLTLVITYPLCHQPTSQYYWREIGYALVLIGCSIICKSQAQIVGAFLMDSVENSVFISCVAVIGPTLLSGIPIRISQMVTPLQIASYGSFLRYGFESLMSLRYGYGMCPCDPELVYGYPVSASERAVPAQLNSFARGIIELGKPINETGMSSNDISSTTSTLIESSHDNVILKFIQLVTEAANLMVPNTYELGDCNKYRSLYLLTSNIPNDILPKWLGIMVLMFIVSRFLTYFVVKAVIKLRHV